MLGRTAQLGDVPGPHFIGLLGQKFWLLILRMTQLIAPFPHLLMLVENSIHGAHGAVVLSFVQQGSPNRRRRVVHKPSFMQYRENLLLLILTQRSAWLGRTTRRDLGLTGSIEGAAWRPQGLTSSPMSHLNPSVPMMLRHFTYGKLVSI